MKKYFYILLILLLPQFGSTQPYGNEWINYAQSYYSFTVTSEGVYRIGYNAMIAANIPANSINPNQFQLFGKEKQIPIRVVDGGDGSFDNGDYIEFFAEGNDGWLDSILYDDPNTIGNPGYSLYNDTLRYFLTWGGSTKRYIQETDVNFNAYTPSNFVIQRNAVNFSHQYYGGFTNLNSYSSFYVPGEGWGSPNYNGVNPNFNPVPTNIPTPTPYLGGDAPAVKFHAKSMANSDARDLNNNILENNHHLRWQVGPSNTVLYDEIFKGYRQTIVNETFSPNLLGASSTTVTFNIINDLGAATDFQSIQYLYLEYARATSMNGQRKITFTLPNHLTQAKSRLDWTDANLTNPVCYVTGGSTARFIPMEENGAVWQMLIPNGTGTNKQQVVIYDDNEIKQITFLQPVNGTGTFTNYNNVNFEGAFILFYHPKLAQAANNYKAYRSSLAGGSHNTVLINPHEVYLQFGGGINKHILGIRRLAHFAYNISIEKPKGMLLLGKGIQEANEPNTTANTGSRRSVVNFENNLIPSYGYPSSDICITNRFNGEKSWAPNIPTGRIAAKTNQELQNYLNKLIVYESNQNQNDTYNKPNKEWQKRVLHFGGGNNSQEHTTFRNYLNNYKNTIEGADFGGNVRSYFKDNSNPFNPVMSSEVNDLLQDGVSLMTFFGHASVGQFDQNIDDPQNWGNTGKYPVVIGNSCYTGDIFQPSSVSASESFILTQDVGAIGFMSSTKLGFASFLNTYTAELYRQFSPKNYGLPLAQQVIETIKSIEGNSTSFLLENTVTQMVLHGDPGMKLNWHGLPEIDLTTQDISFTPNKFDLSTDSLTVQVVLTNLGRSILDTFSLEVRRSFPNSSIDSLYKKEVYGLHFKDTFHFTMSVQQEIGIGLNRFSIQADIPSFVPELYDEYGNNQVTVDLFVNIDGIVPVLPYNYAVVPDDSVVLKASTINPIASYNTYRFEIDTTDLFNSPFKKYALVSGLGGVKEVHPNEWRNVNSNMASSLTLEDSVAYFWRVAVDSTSPQWTEHSFQYIKGKEGWGQDHFYQFKNGGFNGIGYDRTTRTRNFKPTSRFLECDVYDAANNNNSFFGTLWKLNSQIMEYGICTTTPSLHVAVIDPATMEPWGTFNNGENVENQFGNVNNGAGCRNRVENYFIFRQQSAAQLQAFENMITNEVPDGHFLLIYTARFAEYNQWQSLHPQLFTTMQNMGFNANPGDPNRAFIFLTQKGDLTSAQSVKATEFGEFIQLSATLEGFTNFGIETSTIIGPAAQWNTLFWKQDPLETDSEDETILSIRALDARQRFMFQIDTTFTRNDSIQNLNDLFPADNYPYLQLRATYKDDKDLTPAQVDRWHVLYNPLPEAAIDGTVAYKFRPLSEDSLREGQDITFAVDVKNISHLPMDSLLINYWVVDRNSNVKPIPYQRQDSLRPGQVLRDTITFSTKGLVGNNVLWMEVNPYLDNFNTLKDQPELAHFNNVLQLPFTIAADDINPLLDVTFDGLHILNGDIVNPNSEIVITLKDNNPFLVMDEDADTSRFGIFITNPQGIQKRIPFISSSGHQVMQWIPANDNNLKFKIIYSARFEEEGEYELLVQGSDKSGNLSGDLEYRIKFDVILGSSITHMMNYPNPFSTKTRFVFTLTGSEVPDELIIQIMTVTGRVVREITQDELGAIRIGRNLSEYAWDGRDEFGDQLANGVYIYRVTARINGEDIEHRNSGADAHFKRNWGKMYLMR